MSSWRRWVVAAAWLWAAGSAGAQPAPTPAQVSADHVRAHMAFLASDLLEGREAGTRGYDIAAAYVASQFTQLGLSPAGGEGSYFQEVPLLANRPLDGGALILRDPKGVSTPLVFGQDYLPGRSAASTEFKIAAPLVFVGYGIVAPERRRNDYAGLDVRGKIVVVLSGAPAAYQTEERAYYASGRTKRLQAQARGAVGVITINTPDEEASSPFADDLRTWRSWGMGWREPGDTNPVLNANTMNLAWISVAGADKLFAGAPVRLSRVWRQAVAPAGDPPRFELPLSLDVTLRTETQFFTSRNIVGLIRGADPILRDEIVVLSAHLDHLGVTAPVNGDGINNGALDNAAGVATTLEVARAFQQSGKPPRRSVMFLIATAEEKGLVGADYFARHPPAPIENFVADVDLDMPILTYDFTDVVAFGAERSSLGPMVRKVAAGMGVSLSPDPIASEGIFVRSDHYRFVEQGVPAVFLMTGFANGGKAAFTNFLAKTYHKPGDDLSQPIDYAVGAKFARLNYEITRGIADADQRPVWNPGDFFGEKFRRGIMPPVARSPGAAPAVTPDPAQRQP